jgi:hypothetical protein
MVLTTVRARARDEQQQQQQADPYRRKEGLELPSGKGVGLLASAPSVVTVVARFGLDDDDAKTGAAPAAAAANANANAPTTTTGGGAFFDTHAAAHAAVRGLGAEQEALLLRRKKPQQEEQEEQKKKGDFLRSASAYFGHEVPVGPAATTAQPPARFRADAVALVDDDSEEDEAATLKKKRPQSAAAAAALAPYDEPNKPYRKGLTASEAPPYTTFPNITGGYRSGGTYLRCLASLVSSFWFFGCETWRSLLAPPLTRSPASAPSNPQPPKPKKKNSSSSTPRPSTPGPPSSATSSASACSCAPCRASASPLLWTPCPFC